MIVRECIAPQATTLNLLDRELGILAFNERVLAQAEDDGVPLLERLRFLTIVSSNLDEFYEIRVSGLHELISMGDAGARAARESLAAVTARAAQLVERQYALLNDVLMPALAAEGVFLHVAHTWNDAHRAWATERFFAEIEPLLTPIALDPAHPFPRVLNKSLNFVIELDGADAFGRRASIAILQAPRALPRLLRVPTEVSGYPHGVMLLSSIVQGCAEHLFPGLTVKGVYQFRVTRNSELFVDDEDISDLRQALQGELPQRHFGDAVRIEVSAQASDAVIALLLREFDLTEADCFRANGPVNLVRMQQVPDMVDRPDLKFPPFTPGMPALLVGQDLFAAIRRQDILLHHPYESFAPVMEFLASAATDPSVVAIKQTIYRTGSDSALMDLLMAAARAGKEVTVVLELFARFDEEANINWAARLE
ncbi:MAG: polyphosphate kinase 1, partial [Burkholderiales bacterium]